MPIVPTSYNLPPAVLHIQHLSGRYVGVDQNSLAFASRTATASGPLRDVPFGFRSSSFGELSQLLLVRKGRGVLGRLEMNYTFTETHMPNVTTDLFHTQGHGVN